MALVLLAMLQIAKIVKILVFIDVFSAIPFIIRITINVVNALLIAGCAEIQ